jgi:glycosyltransferase involved in cell wall biosynthesis
VPEPLVSVVVSTHNRAARLARLLEGLRTQRLARDRFEVIVVDDGSGADTGELLRRWEHSDELELRVIRSGEPVGPAAARNTGWRAAMGELIAFTDDDCVPEPSWLVAAIEAQRQAPGAIVQGKTIPDPSEAAAFGLFSRSVRVDSLGPQYETCNIFYPRDLLERLGGFDERFGTRPAAEDTDLAWRAIASGAKPLYAPESVVFHAVEALSAGAALRLPARWSAAMRVFADHPGTRAMLYRGVFWNVWHYLLWRSLAAMLAPSWLRRMILTLHLVQLRKRARAARSSALAIPFLLVYDLVECWAVARGAVRHRTLVL